MVRATVSDLGTAGVMLSFWFRFHKRAEQQPAVAAVHGSDTTNDTTAALTPRSTCFLNLPFEMPNSYPPKTPHHLHKSPKSPGRKNHQAEDMDGKITSNDLRKVLPELPEEEVAGTCCEYLEFRALWELEGLHQQCEKDFC